MTRKVLLASTTIINRSLATAKKPFWAIETTKFIPYPPLKQATINPKTKELHLLKDWLKEEFDKDNQELNVFTENKKAEQKIRQAWKKRCLEFVRHCGRGEDDSQITDDNQIICVFKSCIKYDLWKEFVNKNLFIASPHAAKSYFDTIKELVGYTKKYLTPKQQQDVALSLLYEFEHHETRILAPGDATRYNFLVSLREYCDWITTLSDEGLPSYLYEDIFLNIFPNYSYQLRETNFQVGFKNLFCELFFYHDLEDIEMLLDEGANIIFTSANSAKLPHYLTEVEEALQEVFPDLDETKFIEIQDLIKKSFKIRGLYLSQDLSDEEISFKVQEKLPLSRRLDLKIPKNKKKLVQYADLLLVVTKSELALNLVEQLMNISSPPFSFIEEPELVDSILHISIVAPSSTKLSETKLFFNHEGALLISLRPDPEFKVDKYIN